MKILKVKPIQHEFIKAMIDIEISSEYGLQEIRDITLFEKGNSSWISMPSKTYEKDGKKKYWSYTYFSSQSKKLEQDILHAYKDFKQPEEQLELPLDKPPF